MNGLETQMTDQQKNAEDLQGETPLGDLDDHGSVMLDGKPEGAVADSLNRALRQLRDDADQIEQMPLDGARIDAAERLADDAAAIDEEIGSIARSDES